MSLALLAAKSDAAAAIKKSQAAAEVESGRKLHILRTDNGGKFTSVEFARHCEDHDVQWHFSTPHKSQQNGVVEKHNQSILATAHTLLKYRRMPAEFWATAHTLLKYRRMPAEFWGEPVSTAAFLNRAPTKSLNDKTPIEAWYGHKPTVTFLHMFGCLG
jgi:transposase InsO family protein